MLRSVVAAALLIIVGLGSLSSAPRSDAARCQIFEIAVVDDRGERAVPQEDGGVVRVDRPSLLTTADFTGANVSLTDGQIVLNIDLSREAGARIQTFSEKHVGVRLAFIVDDRAIKVARILDPIHKDGILMGPFERSEADALAASINRCHAR